MVLEPGLEKVQNLTDINNGIYLLEIKSCEDFILNHRLFNKYIFPKGIYYYAGSAQKNLHHRIKRHLSHTKKLHWHIDYLTLIKSNTISNIVIFRDLPKSYECKIVNDLIKYFNLQKIIPNFGNSDCNSCSTHLLYNPKPINYSHFTSLYHSQVLLIPCSSDISCL